MISDSSVEIRKMARKFSHILSVRRSEYEFIRDNSLLLNLLFPIEPILSHHQYHQIPRNIRPLRADLQSTKLSDRFHHSFEYASEICGRISQITHRISVKDARNLPAMFVQITLSLKCESTEPAGEWSLVCVRANMLLKHRWLCTIELTIGTNVSSRRGSC